MSINQDTFDEVVKENMEDFGMDKEEAARDAIEQFKFQGTVTVSPSKFDCFLSMCGHLATRQDLALTSLVARKVW